MHGALAALAALRHRDRTGEGQHIDVALLDSMLFQSTGYLTLAAMGVDLPRLGNEFRIAAPANTYHCRDGLLMAGVILDSHWKRLARALSRPELADVRLAVAAVVLAILLAAVVWLHGGPLADPTDPRGPWQLRASNFRSAWLMSGDHPWTGVGPGAFSEAYPSYRRAGDNEVRHAHNLAFELVAEWGRPVGGALSLLFFAVFLSPLWRERGHAPPWRRGLAVGLCAFALQNLADFTAFMPSLLWLAALLRGLIGRPPAPCRSRSAAPRILAGLSTAVVVLAACAAAAHGLSSNAAVTARSLAFAGEREAALRLSARAARLAPWDVDAALLHARLSAEMAADGEGLKEAQRRVDRAVRLSPVRASARALRARIRLRNRDPLGAFADLDRAARLYPAKKNYADERDRLQAGLTAIPEDPRP